MAPRMNDRSTPVPKRDLARETAEAAPGDVISYKLSPEELARYQALPLPKKEKPQIRTINEEHAVNPEGHRRRAKPKDERVSEGMEEEINKLKAENAELAKRLEEASGRMAQYEAERRQTAPEALLSRVVELEEALANEQADKALLLQTLELAASPKEPAAPHDPVNRPRHYTQGGIECIDAIEAAVIDLRGPEAFLTGQVIKYIWRWKHKGGTEDLEKAQWYVARLQKKMEVAE